MWVTSLGDCSRIQVESTEVEVCCGPGSIPVAKTSGIAPELLDHGVEGLGSSVGCSSHLSSRDLVEMLLVIWVAFLMGSRKDQMAQRYHLFLATPGPAARFVVSKAHRMRLDRPSLRRASPRRAALSCTPATADQPRSKRCATSEIVATLNPLSPAPQTALRRLFPSAM